MNNQEEIHQLAKLIDESLSDPETSFDVTSILTSDDHTRIEIEVTNTLSGGDISIKIDYLRR